MAFNVDKLLSKVKNPADKLSELFEQKAETALLGALNDAFAKIGLGASSRKGLLNNLAGAALASLASEIFGGSKSKARGANTFNDPPEGGDQGVADADTADDRTGKMSFAADFDNEFGSQAGLKFPSNLGEYCMMVDIKEYKRPNPTETGTFDTKKTIYLPLPRAMVDTHEVKYDSMETGVVGAIADRLSGNGPERNTLGRTVTEAAIISGADLLGKSRYGDSAIGIAGQAAGGIINPNLGVFFKGPTLREHRFDWLLAPENEDEMKSLQEIIVLLKRASLPNYAKNNNTAFLQYPNMIHIKLLPWAEKDTGTKGSKGYENNYLYIYKHAMITNLSVNYAPDSPVFIKTDETTKAGPAFIGVTMTIMEIEYFTADDYGGIAGLRNQIDVSAESIIDGAKEFLNIADPQSLVDNPDQAPGTPVANEEVTASNLVVRATTEPTTKEVGTVDIQDSIFAPDPVSEYLRKNDIEETDETRARYTAELTDTIVVAAGEAIATTKIYTITEKTNKVAERAGAVMKLTAENGTVKYGYRENQNAPIQIISKESYDNFANNEVSGGFDMTTSSGRIISVPTEARITSTGTDPNRDATYIGNPDGTYTRAQSGD